MKLLMLGGTEFVGRAVVEEALRREWEVTVFHRGAHAAPEGVTDLIGDREGDLAELAAAPGEWDVVVDTWSAAPSVVRASARLLAERAGSYAYVSSRSVYAYPAGAGADEDAPVVEAAATDGAEVDYARAKAGGELAAKEFFGAEALLVRAGLILGPYENIGRLPWWLRRTARGGPVLAPGPRDLELQYIDVRDLAVWTLDAIAAGLGGPYNLVSPPAHTTMGEFLDACVQVTAPTAAAPAELRWTDPAAIEAAGIEPWTQLPVWLPPGELHDTMHRSDVTRALTSGLHCRPVLDTVTDTWTWLQSLPGDPPQRPDRARVGLDRETEEKFLAGAAG
ncbi:NAD-dependent epimerase/dehydratase family protein [Streptomyces sp. NPDC051976]|uniref:NAD-dependent epimerase/dehydratase family protein n=1 Tax=Streptomyces sp. NPDC051976 TaxID=3154947 RepID=UPI003432D740